MLNRELLLQYTRDLLRLKGIQESLAELLVEILRKANYDNQIILNATIKSELGEKMGYSLGTIDNALTRFVNDGLLIREGRGVYLHHVAIYIGNNQYIHAPQPGQSVQVGSFSWFKPDFGIRL